MAIRAAAVAGTWYPGQASRLVAELDEYLDAAAVPELPGRLVGLVAPHAGLRYSGPVAAHAYKVLNGRKALTALLVGPSHRASFHGVSVHASGAFETPLGLVSVDEGIAAQLIGAHPMIVDAARPHRDEHSLEMQLPFLQHLVPHLTIVPMLMGTQGRDEVEALAPALAAAAQGRDDVVLVASSDLSHYHPAHQAKRLDALVVGDVDRLDPERLQRRLEEPCEVAPHLDGGSHACGGGPMVAVMKAARLLGASQATVLRYADSGDAGEGDKSRVVGYLAAAFTAVR